MRRDRGRCRGLSVQPGCPVDVPRRQPLRSHRHSRGDRSDSSVMHDGSAVARPPRGPAGTIRTLQRPPEQGRLGNRDAGVAVLALVFVPQPRGMSRVMDRCADAAAIGVKKPDESLPAPAFHSGSAETISGSGWRCWQEGDIVRSGRSLDPSDDSPGVPFVDRSPDALSPLFVKSRIDRVWDDAVGPEELVFNWRKASSYGPRARRGLRRTTVFGALRPPPRPCPRPCRTRGWPGHRRPRGSRAARDRSRPPRGRGERPRYWSRQRVAPGSQPAREPSLPLPPQERAPEPAPGGLRSISGRRPVGAGPGLRKRDVRAHRAVRAALAGEVRTGGRRERVRDRALLSVDRALDGSRKTVVAGDVR